jgi:hypothetical protein
MSPNEPDLPPQEQPDVTPAPELEPGGAPEEMPPLDPGVGGDDIGQPVA